MKKSSAVSLAFCCMLVLAGGLYFFRAYTRERPVYQVFPEGNWTSVYGELWTGPEVCTSFIVAPDVLYEKLEKAFVTKSSKSSSHTTPYFRFLIHSDGGTDFELTIEENGKITCAEFTDLAGTRQFWKLTDDCIYTAILKREEIKR